MHLPRPRPSGNSGPVASACPGAKGLFDVRSRTSTRSPSTVDCGWSSRSPGVVACACTARMEGSCCPHLDSEKSLTHIAEEDSLGERLKWRGMRADTA
jgi:hypothetical protein